jgi:hypothetical protein
MVMLRGSLAGLLTIALLASPPSVALGQVPPAASEASPAREGDDAAGRSDLPRSGTAGALATGGTVLAGLGALAIIAAGVSWLAAAGNAAKLDDECPDKICYEGTPGGDALEDARDAEKAAGVLVGVGTPVLAGGLVLLLFSKSLASSDAPVRALPAVGQGFAGGAIQGRF